MKTILIALFTLSTLVLAVPASAQPFAFADASATAHSSTFSVGAAYFFRGHRVQPGFAIDALHAFDLNRPAPDFDAYGSLCIGLSSSTFLLANLGAGATFATNVSVSWSARALFILTQSAAVGPRATVFAMWTPETGGVFVNARVGPNIRLGTTNWRLFPHIGIGITAPTVDAQLEAGVSLLWTPP